MTDEHGREGLAFRRTVEQAGVARLSHLVVTDPELSDGAVRLYARLLWYARRDVRCWPGRERLAQDLRGAWRAMDLRNRLAAWWRVVTGEDYWQTHLEATDA